MVDMLDARRVDVWIFSGQDWLVRCISSAWRLTPVFEKMCSRCVFAVVLLRGGIESRPVRTGRCVEAPY